jgi:hypothetical protein
MVIKNIYNPISLNYIYLFLKYFILLLTTSSSHGSFVILDIFLNCKHCLQDSSGIFWDNDSLAGLLALELKADLLVLLSDVEGLYSGPPNDPSSRLIHTYIKEKHQNEITFGDKSRLGRGGMTAKVNAAVCAAHAGIPVIITRYLTFFYVFHFSGKVLALKNVVIILIYFMLSKYNAHFYHIMLYIITVHVISKSLYYPDIISCNESGYSDICHEQYYKNLHAVHDLKYTFGFYILLTLKLYFDSV